LIIIEFCDKNEYPLAFPFAEDRNILDFSFKLNALELFRDLPALTTTGLRAS
jgi:hypothetical protein